MELLTLPSVHLGEFASERQERLRGPEIRKELKSVWEFTWIFEQPWWCRPNIFHMLVVPKHEGS